MSLFIGLVLALLSAAVAALVRFDRRTFYATVLIVVAHYYVLFAIMAGAMRAVMLESLIMAVFIVLAVVGFRRSSLVLALGLCAHGVMDVFHGQILTNPGVPEWWPSFCMAYDVVASLALIVLRSRAAVPNLTFGSPACLPATTNLP